MKECIPKFFIALLAILLPAGAFAQTDSPGTPANPAPPAAPSVTTPGGGQTSATSPVFTPAEKPTPPAIRRNEGIVSAGLAAQLADGRPKFNPPAPPAPAVADLRETDKPKNEIPRLPKYVVQGAKPPVFTNTDLLSKDGFTDLMLKEHPGLNAGNLFGANVTEAREMAYEQDRLDKISDLTDTARAMKRGGDDAESRFILDQARDTSDRAQPQDIPHWEGPGTGDGR